VFSFNAYANRKLRISISKPLNGMAIFWRMAQRYTGAGHSTRYAGSLDEFGKGVAGQAFFVEVIVNRSSIYERYAITPSAMQSLPKHSDVLSGKKWSAFFMIEISCRRDIEEYVKVTRTRAVGCESVALSLFPLENSKAIIMAKMTDLEHLTLQVSSR